MRRVRRHSIGGSVPVLPSETSVEEKGEREKSMIVAVRLRPLSEKEVQQGCKSTCSVIDDKVVTIRRDCRDGGVLKSQATQLNEYGFDCAFGVKCTQREVYEKTAAPFIPNLLKGLHVTVFAYGATGAGKTHTMLGNSRVDDASGHTSDAGIIPHSVRDLFDRIEEKKVNLERGESWTVSLSFVEIYNEQVYDLLHSGTKPLSLREDADRGVVVVAGVEEKTTQSASDVMELLAKGNKNRKTEATMANAVSSRSHAVLQLCIKHVTRSPDTGRETAVESKLSMIDLAGSERASATNNRGARLQEGANINKSLLALANCINALASRTNSGKKMNVKYRDSRLTHLLKSSLEGGNCNLVMIANINPSHTTFEDSHNTLKYANRAKNIKVNPTVTAASVESNWMQREEHLREENKALRARVTELEALINSLSSQVSKPSTLSSSSSSSSSAVVESSHQRNLGVKVSQDDMSCVPASSQAQVQEQVLIPPIAPKPATRRPMRSAALASDANPFLEVIMPSGSRKRKATDRDREVEEKVNDMNESDAVDMKVEPKEEEVRGVSLADSIATPPLKSKRVRNSLGSVAAPNIPASSSSRTHKTRRSSLGERENVHTGSEGGTITFNAVRGTGLGFTIAQDEVLTAKPPQQKPPSTVSTRRKSLAAVNAMLDSIVDENAYEGKAAQPKRALPDLSRLLGGKGRGDGVSKDNHACQEARSMLTEETWIDI